MDKFRNRLKIWDPFIIHWTRDLNSNKKTKSFSYLFNYGVIVAGTLYFMQYRGIFIKL